MLGVSLFPCRRSHPARVVRRVSQCATAHAAFAFPVAGSASGAAHFRGHHCVRLRYSLETRPHPADEVVERLQKVGFPSPCSPSYRALAFSLVGLSPTEHASLSWTHIRTGYLSHHPALRFPCFFDCGPLPQSWIMCRNVSALRISRTLTSWPWETCLTSPLGSFDSSVPV